MYHLRAAVLSARACLRMLSLSCLVTPESAAESGAARHRPAAPAAMVVSSRIDMRTPDGADVGIQDGSFVASTATNPPNEL